MWRHEEGVHGDNMSKPEAAAWRAQRLGWAASVAIGVGGAMDSGDRAV
jgi:hypothetical protein